MILLLLLLLTSHLIQISSMSLFALEASERWLLLFPESSDLHSWQGDLSGRSGKFWELKVRSRENRFRLFYQMRVLSTAAQLFLPLPLVHNKYNMNLFTVVSLHRDCIAELSGRGSSLSRGELTVVTGRGRHSHNGVARLRPAVITFLNANRYQYVGSFYLVVPECCFQYVYDLSSFEYDRFNFYILALSETELIHEQFPMMITVSQSTETDFIIVRVIPFLCLLQFEHFTLPCITKHFMKRLQMSYLLVDDSTAG